MIPAGSTKMLCRFAASAVASTFVALAGCGSEPPSAPPPPKVVVAHPVSREVTEWDEYTARLEAVEAVEIRPRVSGYLQLVLFKEGALVQKGDLLLLIDSRPYEAKLRHAEADLAMEKSKLALAQKNLARAVDLLRTHAISQEDADIRESTVRQAEANVAQSEAAVDSAKLDVEFTEIVAPISGRIGRRLVTEGNLVTGGVGTQGTLLATIVSLDPIYAYFDVDERSVLKYIHLDAIGERKSSREFRNPVWIGIGDEVGFPRAGRMDFVDNQLDPGTGTIVARGVFPNPDLELAPGLFARLRLAGSGLVPAVLIPDEAVGSDQSQKFVFVVDAENRAQYRAIRTGPMLDGLRIVREGLTPQDRVIVSGTQRARSGQVVDPQQPAAAAVPASPAAASPAAASVPDPPAAASVPAPPAAAGGGAE